MHKLHLVINKKPLKPEKITEILENEGFIEEKETYYIQSSGHGDWFVIGGRWTGILQKPTKNFFEFVDMYKTKPDRQEFWQDNPPKWIYVHHKRMSFQDNKATDSIEYAHFVWQKGEKPKQALLRII